MLRALDELTLSERPTLEAFRPPPRFDAARFATYRPQHPTQQEALERARAFARGAAEPLHTRPRWPWQSPRPRPGQGLYLDGGFGVGKTHLLASAYHAYQDDNRAYLSFQELVYVIGALGKVEAQRTFADYALICIDEFELDDPGNTLIVKSFLAFAFGRGSFVVTTSNTPPDAQGQGRFNANDFRREIQNIAERFTTLRMEGRDYRQRERLARPYSEAELDALLRTESSDGGKVVTTLSGLIEFLQQLHPIRYRDVLRQIGTLYVREAHPIAEQNNALRFVHFIDKLYDLGVGLRLSGGLELPELFHPSYAHGAYAKKHDRCVSRLSELIEAPAAVAA
ncbi:MAG: cell division protein ZapE [Trueperaceae bacterium]|nr:cell division protein ZapE [Trueperaceae bacterium]